MRIDRLGSSRQAAAPLSIGHDGRCRRYNRLNDRCRGDHGGRGHDRSRHDGRRGHDRCRRDDDRCRRGNGRTDHTANNAPDETRPEVTPATPPTAMVVMMAPAVMNDGTSMKTMMEPSMMEPVRTCQTGPGTHNSGKSRNNRHFHLIHVCLLFRLFGAYIPLGMLIGGI